MEKINKKTKIADITAKQPKLAQFLAEKYGLHCVGCMAAPFETIEQGAQAHGMNKAKIEKMIVDLNKRIKRTAK